MLLSTGFKSGLFWGHSLSGINSGVSFCNSEVVARVRWAFQVSPGSVETLLKWGGKRLHHFAANLFGKRSTKFLQNRPSFVRDITKKHLVSFPGSWICGLETDRLTMGFMWVKGLPVVEYTPWGQCSKLSLRGGCTVGSGRSNGWNCEGIWPGGYFWFWLVWQWCVWCTLHTVLHSQLTWCGGAKQVRWGLSPPPRLTSL